MSCQSAPVSKWSVCPCAQVPPEQADCSGCTWPGEVP
ncbi:unnamed protein product, partial [Staurois parvus]